MKKRERERKKVLGIEIRAGNVRCSETVTSGTRPNYQLGENVGALVQSSLTCSFLFGAEDSHPKYRQTSATRTDRTAVGTLSLSLSLSDDREIKEAHTSDGCWKKETKERPRNGHLGDANYINKTTGERGESWT
jgi:hypothetical protein